MQTKQRDLKTWAGMALQRLMDYINNRMPRGLAFLATLAVDVMLVVLIIFLITIPVLIQSVPVELPKERNLPTQAKPENIVIAVNKDGDVFWSNQLVPGEGMLLARLREVAVRQPQPEIHIRGDKEARYESIGRGVLPRHR